MRGSRQDLRALVAHLVCLSLLTQTAGIAGATPSLPNQQWVVPGDLAGSSAGHGRETPDSETDGRPRLRVQSEAAWRTFSAARSARQRLASAWSDWMPGTETEAEPTRLAQLGGSMPLPPRLMSLLLGLPAAAQGGPPSPPGRQAAAHEPATASQLAALAQKAASEQIPLLPGFNLVSLPEEPADTDPAAVLEAIAGQFRRVEAFDACDPADPWKVFDPAVPEASNLAALDHRRGWWIDATTATALPADGTLPASTSIDLCPGWNLIGFPAAEPRHPLVALASIAGRFERVFGYDAFDSEDPWEIFDPAVPDWANDLERMQPGRGYWVLATEATTLEIRNQGPPPAVAISAPDDLAVITQPTEIFGTVDSDRLEAWILRYRAIGDGDAVTLATGTTPVVAASLATFDPTLLLNGLYELELSATDLQGQQVSERVAVAVEGQMKIGHFTLAFVDLAIPLSGLDIEVVRTYDSRDKRPGDFGVGWTLDIRQGSYRNNRPPGDG